MSSTLTIGHLLAHTHKHGKIYFRELAHVSGRPASWNRRQAQRPEIRVRVDAAGLRLHFFSGKPRSVPVSPFSRLDEAVSH